MSPVHFDTGVGILLPNVKATMVHVDTFLILSVLISPQEAFTVLTPLFEKFSDLRSTAVYIASTQSISW